MRSSHLDRLTGTAVAFISTGLRARDWCTGRCVMLIWHLRYLLLISFVALGLTVGFANPASAQVGERGATRYYMLMFAQQTEPNVARRSHTFAMFVRASGPEADPNAQIDVQTISWMPHNMKIEPLRMNPQPGANFTLADTLDW